MVAVITAGEAGRGGERPVPDGEVAHVLVDVTDDGCAAADEERQLGPGCRICHLPDVDGDGLPERRLSGRLVRLGCGCRGELAAAHRRCAEAWFFVRGNRRCEICGENAVNITGGSGKEFIRQWHDTAAVDGGGGSSKACGGFCRSQSLCNLLIVLLAVAFLLTWFFHNHVI